MHREKLMSEYKDKLNKLMESKDDAQMMAAHRYMTNLTKHLLDMDYKVVESALQMWDSVDTNNFVTQEEAMKGIDSLINRTGEGSPKWRHSALFDMLQSLGLPKEKEGIFNEWALFYTMNWLYSDYAEELLVVVKNDTIELVNLIYKMSISKLTDPDREKWVRKHLGLDEW